MNRSTLITLFLVALLPLSIFAQKSKVISGVLAYDEGAYEEAVDNFKTALQNPSDLKEKDQAKAYSYLGRSYMGIYQLAARKLTNPDTKAEGEALLKKYPSYAQDAYDAFMKAKKLDDKGRFVDGNKQMYVVLWQALYQQAVAAYSELEAYDVAKDMINKSLDLAKDLGMAQLEYNSLVLRGFVNVNQENYDDAVADFRAGLDKYNSIKDQLKQEDPNIAKVYENLIFIYSEHKDDKDKALATIEEAKRDFPDSEAIRDMELQVYQSNPDLYDEGIKKFEQALEKDPDNVKLLINYATMVESKDLDKAVSSYKKVLQQEPDNFIANFNLGGVYINQSKEMDEEIREIPTSEQAKLDKKMEEQNEVLRKAYKYMKKASDQQTDNLQAARAVWQIAARLELPEEPELKKRYDAANQ